MTIIEDFNKYFNDETYINTYDKIYAHTQSQTDFLGSLFDTYLLKTESTIIDFCCGQGRHLIELTKKGYNVHGIDINKNLLDEIEKSETSSITTFLGDIRSFKFPKLYDFAYNIETSIGYFGKNEDKRIINNMYNSIGNNGYLLIHVMNKDWVITNSKEKQIFKDINGKIVQEMSVIDKLDGTLTVTQSRPTKMGRDFYKVRLQLYSKEELIKLLEASGFTIIELFGDFFGKGFNPLSRDLIILAKK